MTAAGGNATGYDGAVASTFEATPIPQECYMTFMVASPPAAPSTPDEPTKSLREKGADSFHAALATALTNGLDAALEAGDHPRAVSFINRGFAEGSPQLGCDLLCRAIAAVGAARTWTVQIAPQRDRHGGSGE
jgi:hypothetical protein